MLLADLLLYSVILGLYAVLLGGVVWIIIKLFKLESYLEKLDKEDEDLK